MQKSCKERIFGHFQMGNVKAANVYVKEYIFLCSWVREREIYGMAEESRLSVEQVLTPFCN